MTSDELREEIAIELELMETTIGEINTLRQDVAGREPTIREKTAALRSLIWIACCKAKHAA